MADQVTIKDIARLLNISPSTVSRALKSSHEINKETQRLVKETAERLHYRPNMAALSLVKAKTKTIGVIVPNLGYYVFSTALQGIEDAASKRGYTVIACQSMEQYEREIKNTQDMMRSSVDGIILSLAQHTKDYQHILELQQSGMPVVLFDRIADELNTSKVIVDNMAGSFGAVEHLIKMGCRRIAYIGGPSELSISSRRKEGYRLALVKYHIPIDEQLVVYCEFNHEKSVKAITQLLKLKNPPDGIFTCSDRQAIAAMVAAQAKKLRIPEDIAIVGFNDEPVVSIMSPALSSVRQPAFEMGQMAAGLLIDQIEQGKSFTPQTKLYTTKLVKRASSKRK
ncbi:LacI family DNA-binding transcriptional regulator [Asinibacterium sp. OR53]|uniref:LacI family DNA-binding transcriptional regulator n=1 Tax=Asinibacterium sp. OR53 TaxID=925409 RepID=UPI00047E0524|nr:LacI family DNA-binding transcriptional regulator [Asinibacterium sp. OR53]